MIARFFRYLRDVIDPVDPQAVMQTWHRPTAKYDQEKAVEMKRQAHQRQAKARKLHDVQPKATRNVAAFRKAAGR